MLDFSQFAYLKSQKKHNMKKLAFGALVCLSLKTFTGQAQEALIPQPQEMTVGKGTFSLGKNLSILKDAAFPEMTYLQKHIEAITGKNVKTQAQKAAIRYRLNPTLVANPEAYNLKIDDTGIEITASSNHGIFYGMQTLLQLIEEHKSDLRLPHLHISDQPKFAYRGMHLDVCRHFFTVDEVKNYLDYLAAYKINKFHWHLTDDQGWRIEIKSHPKLTEIGAFRKPIAFGDEESGRITEKGYGGFYTQEEIKDVVAYAQKLHIEIIPEIEMPGHAQAALAAYPELSCTGGPFEVGTVWGVIEDIFCPKEETFALLEDVIDEVIPLFPSQYIHIGGDEAPKKRWEACPHCQELIKKEGLKGEHELQSYFITRMEKYINGKGKKIIGWDEILEGGLAPNATVMSWTGIQGGIEAAKSGHDAIMTPASHVYFDYYQGNPETEPAAFNAQIRLEKVYSYDPIPQELTSEQSKHILGAQANMWTEYIPTFKQVQHMLFPRLMALSEVTWGTSNPEDYKGFEKRVVQHFKILDRKGINYSKAIHEVIGRIKHVDGIVAYELSTAKDPQGIRYTVDGTEPTVSSLPYIKPIAIDKSLIIKSAYFEDGKQISATTTKEFVHSKSTGKSITLESQPNEAYSRGGAAILVDGVFGSKNYHQENWLGFNKGDMVATIDFGTATDISSVLVSAMESTGSWIHYPTEINIYVSNDNQNFRLVKSVDRALVLEAKGNPQIAIGQEKTRYLKVEAKRPREIPAGNPGAGLDAAYIFIDEITVN
ncbi:hexosaminidase [Sphingobacterium wenxiniae]|uniref:beta-N-acetylhexosaminidase n=2 Tax=Sphingobacterium wenxiniae TaxID=683125 RepID=A0A1I6U0W9_9SPHI|nr:hexosaminidase [Sphingobacterium wenxiniae]